MCCDKGRNMQIRGVWQKAVQNRIRVMKSTSPDRTRGNVQFPESSRSSSERSQWDFYIQEISIPFATFIYQLLTDRTSSTSCPPSLGSNPCPLRAQDTFSSRVLVLFEQEQISANLLCQEISLPFATFFYQLLIDLTSSAQLLNLSRIPFQSIWTLFI